MEHIMKLNESSFNDLVSGKKIREYRLYDEKRKNIRISDTIKFLKLPNLDDEFIVDVENIEVFDNWYDCYNKYFEEDFSKRYKNVKEVVNDTHCSNFYTKAESEKNKCVVFTIKKHRVSHFNSTACYLKIDNKVLMLKFNKKWGKVFAPPGGKFEIGESPLECIKREFFEETGLTLINPRLQGISYWKDSAEGIIFIYTADKYEGKILESDEGKLEWVNLEKLQDLEQFDKNKKFTPYLFKDELFEGKFILNNKCNVLDYKIRNM